MAIQTFFPIPKSATGGLQNTTKVTALGAGTSSAEIVLGNYQLFMIAAYSPAAPTGTTNINIRFGPAGLGAATASDFGLPVSGLTTSGLPMIFDTGREFSSIRVFNNTSGTVDIYVMLIQRA